jgi:hypothetical protein
MSKSVVAVELQKQRVVPRHFENKKTPLMGKGCYGQKVKKRQYLYF